MATMSVCVLELLLPGSVSFTPGGTATVAVLVMPTPRVLAVPSTTRVQLPPGAMMVTVPDSVLPLNP